MDSDAVEADDYLEKLPARVVENIICELSKNEAWLKVAKELESVFGKNMISDGYKMNTSSPEREFFNSLMNRYPLKVRILQGILENCQIYDALRIINTNDPAQILDPVEDATYLVSLGGKVSLPVEVSGSPFPEIEWWFEGRPLIGQTSPLLVLDKFSLKDVGEYTCKIKQRLKPEQTSPKYILNVKNTPPKISVTLKKEVEIKAHEDLTLSFEVIGYPEPKSFRWFKDGNSMPILETEIPQLRIKGVDVHNAGEYYCTALNTVGCCTTEKTIVKVKDPVMCPEKAEIIEQPQANQVYFADDWMYLTCKVHCSEDVKFTCFLNDEELIENDDAVLTTSSSRNQHWCRLSYCLTKEQMEKENLKQLHFKFAIASLSGHSGQILSDDVKMEVKTRDVKKTLTARNKWALVIGNSHYQEMVELPGSRNDIHTMKNNFNELYFRVLMFSDLNRTAIQNAVKKFATFVQEGDYVTFFYAGHGMHNDGKDYILPVDAKMNYASRPQNVSFEEPYVSFDECISHVWITNVLQEHKPALMFSIYDTCRKIEPKFEGCQSQSSQGSYQTALKNSFTLFATSENYEAFEMEELDTSYLVYTLRNLMTHKISVQNLSTKVLEKFIFPEDCDDIQVPIVHGDLALPRSLADPSLPQQIDLSEYGVLKKWEQFGSGRGRIQHYIQVGDTRVGASTYWNIEPRKDGVTWAISNCLYLTLILSQADTSRIQEMKVHIKLWTGKEILQDLKKLNGNLSMLFLVHHLQDLEDRLQIELNFTYKRQQYKGEIHLETPAISQLFYRDNQLD